MENAKKLKVAVIGLGNIGKVVAANLVKGNRPVIIADKTFAKSESLAKELGSLATPMQVAEAIQGADVLVLAIYFASIKELFLQYGTQLNGKIIVDPSNPIAPDEKGGFKKIIGEKESAGQLNADILPAGAKLAKAFGTLGAASLGSASFQAPEKSVLFYATDDDSIDSSIEELIIASGFNAVKVGGINQSIRIEVFGDLHEFGAIGKPVIISEAKSKL